MKVAKILVITVLVYVGIVVAFESLLGYFQPENQRTLVITTIDGDGNEFDRVLARLESQEQVYIAVNHWPRAWYYRVLDFPDVKVDFKGEITDYVAVPVTGAEYDQVNSDNALPLFFKFLTGFPPRGILRLDPA